LLQEKIIIRQMGLQPYEPVSQAMHQFTDEREDTTPDEIWLVEHTPVFTQGQAGKAEHVLMPGDIPVIQSDRGGQVTLLEQTVVNTLAEFAIDAYPRPDAPGVYVDGKKICSLGLRIRKGCSFHGLALNINMDLGPFLRINPCGYAGMEMTQVSALSAGAQLEAIQPRLVHHFLALLNNPPAEYISA